MTFLIIVMWRFYDINFVQNVFLVTVCKAQMNISGYYLRYTNVLDLDLDLIIRLNLECMFLFWHPSGILFVKLHCGVGE